MRRSENHYKNLLRGKRVSLVCPSKALQGCGLGMTIEEADLVVRLNNGYDFHPEFCQDFGNRTDILYHYLGLKNEYRKEYDLQQIQSLGTQIIVIPPRPERINFGVFSQKNQSINLDYLKINVTHTQAIWKEIGCLPFCGVWAVFHLLQYPIKSLNVYGMNFFQTGHYHGYDNRTEQQQIAYALNSQHHPRGITKQHHITPQIELIQNLSIHDCRLTLDQITSQAIQQQHYEKDKL